MLIIYLFSENKIRKYCYGGVIGYEVGDRFYDILGVVLLSQAGQEFKLDFYGCKFRL